MCSLLSSTIDLYHHTPPLLQIIICYTYIYDIEILGRFYWGFIFFFSSSVCIYDVHASTCFRGEGYMRTIVLYRFLLPCFINKMHLAPLFLAYILFTMIAISMVH